MSGTMNEEDGETLWTGYARVDPAAVFVVGEDVATAADLVRWVRWHRERETDWDLTRTRWIDAALGGLAVAVFGVIVLIWMR